MLYTRESKSEWDSYANIGDRKGLKQDNMLLLLKKMGHHSNTGINLTLYIIGREVDT